MASMKDQEWLDWTDKFLAVGNSKDINPMTVEQSKAFISMNFLERDRQAWVGLQADLSKDFLWNVLQKRADVYKLKYTVPMLAFVRFITDSPGKAVMWVHALKRLEQNIKGEVSMTTLAYAFPIGFPTDAALSKLWDEQKGIGGAVDNYLDTVTP